MQRSCTRLERLHLNGVPGDFAARVVVVAPVDDLVGVEVDFVVELQ